MIRVLGDILSQAVHLAADKQAVFHKAETMTYAQVGADAERLAAVLLAEGVGKGDRVSFYFEKCFEKVTSIFAIAASGGVFVPIRKLSTSSQVAHIVHDSGSRILITTYGKFGQLREARASMPGLSVVIAAGNPKDAGGDLPEGIKVIDWKEALASAGRPHPPLIVETDLAAILYTSGSTGKPKGVVLSHLNLVAGARSVSEFLKITENDRLLSVLTFGFDYGLNQLTTAFLHRAQIVLIEQLFVKDIVNAARKYQVTGIACVGTTWIQLMQIPWTGEDVPHLRYVTNSGGAIPEPFVREMRRRLPKVDIYLMYGLTEAFRSTFLDPSLVDQHPTSIGKAIPGEEIMVLGEDGRPVPPGGTGELVHRGVLVAQGYWNAPELTAIRYKRNPLQPKEVVIPEMAVFSGDTVRIDEKGLLYFVGRRDEMIKSSGFRISPTEVEDMLYATGLVATAVALGVHHEVLGQTVYAVVVPADGKPAEAGPLLEACRKLMPSYMVPKDIEFRESLPKNTNGKLDRAKIKSEVLAKVGEGGH